MRRREEREKREERRKLIYFVCAMELISLSHQMVDLLIRRMNKMKAFQFGPLVDGNEKRMEQVLGAGIKVTDCSWFRHFPECTGWGLTFPKEFKIRDTTLHNLLSLTHITHLQLGECIISPQQVEEILKKLVTLEYFFINKCNLSSLTPFSSSSEEAAATVKRLKQLALILYNPLPSSEVYHLFSLVSLKSLVLGIRFDPPLRPSVPKEYLFHSSRQTAMGKTEWLNELHKYFPHLELCEFQPAA